MNCVALFGGTGRLGRHVASELQARGMTLRMLVRSPQKLVAKDGMAVIEGDVHDIRAVARTLEGAAMVVSTLGSAGEAKADVSSTAIANLIPAMTALSLVRIVSITGSAARLDREIGSEHPRLTARREMLMRHMAPLILDGEEHMRLLANSKLAWTVVRAPIMTAGKTVAARLTAIPPAPDTNLCYGVVAKAIAHELLKRLWIGEAPFLTPSSQRRWAAGPASRPA